MGDFKKIILPLVGVMIFIAGVGFLINKNQTKNETTEIIVGGTQVKVRLADTEDERKTGLSETQKLAGDEGMLFIFDQRPIKPTFWMKDMQIAIDIIWIKDNKISQIEKNLQPPEPNTKDDELKRYEPNHSIDYVLEVQAGFSDSHQLKAGDDVLIKL